MFYLFRSHDVLNFLVVSVCRAEVGLLSHNVVIQGSVLEDTSGHFEQGADMFGAQVLIHRAGPHPTPIRFVMLEGCVCTSSTEEKL